MNKWYEVTYIATQGHIINDGKHSVTKGSAITYSFIDEYEARERANDLSQLSHATDIRVFKCRYRHPVKRTEI